MFITQWVVWKMDDKVQRNPGLSIIGKIPWLLPVFFGCVAVASILFEQLVDVSAFQPALQWTLRIGLIFGVGLITFLLATRWAKRVQSQGEQIDQRLLAMRELINITLDIVSELDEDKVLQDIAQRSADLVAAPFGSLLLYDKEHDGVRLVAQTPYKFNLTGSIFKRGEGVAGVVLETAKPVIVNGYSKWEHHISTSLLPLDAFIGVPLKWKGQVIGTLSIGDELTRRSFTEADAWQLQPFADLASIAINNSRMFGEVKQLTKELEKRDVVKTVQLAQTQEELIQKTVQLQRQLKRVTQIQETERARISHDMHDSTTQLILAAVYATQAVMNGMDANPERSRVQLQTIQILLHQIEIEIRETIRNLRPIILDQEGIAVALKQYVDRVAVIANLKCEFQITGTPSRLPEDYEVAVYRIVQEALQNVTTHSHAKKVNVRIQFLEKDVVVEVEDDGVGFILTEETLQDANHFGLVGMRERAESIGASFRIITQPDHGTRAILDIPRPL